MNMEFYFNRDSIKDELTAGVGLLAVFLVNSVFDTST